MILTCTSHWPVCNCAKLNLHQFPLCRVTSQLDVATLSSNVFPFCTIQKNLGNFFNLDSRFAKVGNIIIRGQTQKRSNRLIRMPVYKGQFLKFSRLMWTPVNSDNGHFFCVPRHKLSYIVNACYLRTLVIRSLSHFLKG